MVRVIPLGGLGEIGLNMMAVEHDDYCVVVDAGLMFPEDYMRGVDLVIPDFQYLRDRKDRIRAVVLTHGHEDHIGAMPFLLKEFPVPVYGTGFTLALLREKLKEHDLEDRADLRRIRPGDATRLGPFTIGYISVNHSIVDGVGLVIETPEGTLIHSGDFRIDSTPVDDQFTDLVRFAHYGGNGVLAFFSDSTNVEKEGMTMSEREVRKTMMELFQSCTGRIIVASFASNISRIQQVVNLVIESGRKVVFNGRSMITNVAIAREQGFIKMPDEIEIRERDIGSYPDDRIAIITTGSQGEPMSALTRMARGKHKAIRIKRGDTIILSSRFIPGNEKAITSVINSLYRMGAHVVYEKVSDIHTSGHAKKEELKLMLSLVKPKFFIPVHGEYRHLVKHAELAIEMGIPEARVLVAEDGDVISFEHNQARIEEKIETGRVLVDGKGVGDVGEVVLRDRRRLSGHGVVVILLAVDEDTGEILHGPDIISRGFVFEDQGGFILEDAKCLVLEVLDELDRPSPINLDATKIEILKRLKQFFYSVLERRPMILPLIIPI